MNNRAQDGPEVFREEWSKLYNGEPPLAWVLRTGRTVPWVRYHALPDSKRYAENDAEHATILARGNAIGDRLLGQGNLCWLIEARADEKSGDAALAGEYKEGDDAYDPTWRFYARSVEWHRGAFDTELKAIAEDRLTAMWMRRRDGVVFAPYDGGFDIFPVSAEQVDVLKAERPDWLSSHPEGL